MICHSEMEYFFSKEYLSEPYFSMTKDIGKFDFYKCRHCDFVFSKTHYELSEKRWEKLNSDLHYYLEENFTVDDYFKEGNMRAPDYLQHALGIVLLVKNDIINSTNMLDYAAGYGCLSKILKKYFDIHLYNFDPYCQSEELSYVFPNESMKFDVVINSALFEHIRDRSDIDKINNLVAEDGCLILHTVICERIPKDPDWFFVGVPVHSAFHTNKSMDILMKQWNYVSSIYSPVSKCWVLFKKEPDSIHEKVDLINEETKERYFYYKKGFVDYWKGF